MAREAEHSDSCRERSSIWHVRAMKGITAMCELRALTHHADVSVCFTDGLQEAFS